MFAICVRNPYVLFISSKSNISAPKGLIFRDECVGELRKLGLGPGFEQSSGSRFGNREGCVIP